MVLAVLSVAACSGGGTRASTKAPEPAGNGSAEGTLEIGVPNVVGDLDKHGVRAAMVGAEAKLHACYTAAIATGAEVKGSLMLQFTVSPNGTASSATFKSSKKMTAAVGDTAASKIGDCIVGVVESLEFPRPADRPVDVYMPLVLKR